MKILFKSIQWLFNRGNKSSFFGRRAYKTKAKNAFQELDKSGVLGENVPYGVLAYFSRDGV